MIRKFQTGWLRLHFWDRGNTHTQRQLIYDKGAKNLPGKEGSLFSKWCWENWTAICKRLKLDPNFTSYKNCLPMMTPSYETDPSRDKAPLLSLWLNSLPRTVLPFLSCTYSSQDRGLAKKRGHWKWAGACEALPSTEAFPELPFLACRKSLWSLLGLPWVPLLFSR